MPVRVAITIAGAVSLGAYEAGVMYELLEAFRTHNAREATLDRKIYVDILTGASAGGMTAAILAQRLLFDGASLQDAFKNPLYKTWVQRIDIHQLVELSDREFGMEWNSLLSSDLVETIGRECLVDSMAPGAPSSPPHNVVELDGDGKPLPLDVGLAITNLDGIDYQLPVVGNPDGGFNYTRSDDQALFHLGHGNRGDAGLWDLLRSAAVACGAFPAAFRPSALKRNRSDYTPAAPSRPKVGVSQIVWPDPGKPTTFVYTDGGVLQNQPLGMAKNFVDARVETAREAKNPDAHCIADDRLYVLVSPHAVKSQARNGLQVAKLTIPRTLIELFHTYIREATFHDWIVAEGMNANIRKFDRQVATLASNVATVPTAPAQFAAAAQMSNILLPIVTQRTAAVTRLRDQYKTEYALVQKTHGASTANSFIETVASLEAAANLADRDVMKIVAVIADGRTELAGSGIASFVGFFSRDFREHDYWMGRIKARVYLQRSDVKRILHVCQWPEEHNWGGPTEEEVSAELPNPTRIDFLPLSLFRQLRPGLASLLYMIRIRPLLLYALVIAVVLVAIVLIVLACAIGHCVVWLIHTVS